MLLLTSTSDEIRLVTSAAGDVDVAVSWVDHASGTITPGRTLTTGITTATTTDIVTGVGSSTQRNVQTLLVRNVHASVSNDVTIQLYDGTSTIDILKVTLTSNEILQYLDGVGFQVLASSGAVKTSQNQGTNATSSSLSTAVLGSDVTNNNGTANTIADVTGLSFAVTSGNKYWFRFTIHYTAAATGTGSRWSINGPTLTFLSYRSSYSLTTTSETVNSGLGAYDLPAASNATSAATAQNLAIVEGIIQPSANGTVIARLASEVSSSAIVAKAGSTVYYQQVA